MTREARNLTNRSASPEPIATIPTEEPVDPDDGASERGFHRPSEVLQPASFAGEDGTIRTIPQRPPGSHTGAERFPGPPLKGGETGWKSRNDAHGGQLGPFRRRGIDGPERVGGVDRVSSDSGASSSGLLRRQ